MLDGTQQAREKKERELGFANSFNQNKLSSFILITHQIYFQLLLKSKAAALEVHLDCSTSICTHDLGDVGKERRDFRGRTKHSPSHVQRQQGAKLQSAQAAFKYHSSI